MLFHTEIKCRERKNDQLLSFISFPLFLVSLSFFVFSLLLFNHIVLFSFFVPYLSLFPSLSVSLINYIKYLMKSFHHHYHYRVERRRKKKMGEKKKVRESNERKVNYIFSILIIFLEEIEKNSFNSFFSSFDDLSHLFHSFPLFIFLSFSHSLIFSLILSSTFTHHHYFSSLPLSWFNFCFIFFVTNNLILSLLHLSHCFFSPPFFLSFPSISLFLSRKNEREKEREYNIVIFLCDFTI